MKSLSSLLALGLFVFFYSCGSDTGNTVTEVTEEVVEEVEEIVEEVEEVVEEVSAVTLEIEGDDKMKFNLTEMKVKAGQEVTVNLVHVGEMAKEAMGHNWVLLNSDVDLPTFAASAIQAKDNDYIPESEGIIAHTGLIGGGETTSVTFTAPEPGTYKFICSFPGHYAMMQGDFIVE